MKAVIVLFIIAVVVVIIGVAMDFSYDNKEVSLRNQAEAQQQANTVIYDKVWKVVAMKTQLPERAKNDFKEVYVELMEARYESGGGTMMKWIQEQNPSFDVQQGLYQDISNSIEALRSEFANVQVKLIDIKREHDNIRMRKPGKWFVGDVAELEIQLVTSTKTSETFDTGVEDDVNVFDN
jgi:hypothetical protein